jgi:hypothetical protein
MRSGFAPQPYYTIRPVLTIPMDQGEPCYWTRSSFHRKMVPAHPPRSRPHPSSPAHPEYSTRPVSKRDVFLVMVAALEPLASAGRLRSGMPHHDAKAVAALVHGLVGEFIDEGLGNTSRARSLEFRRRSDDPAGTEHPIPRHHQGIAEETPTTGAESESPPACRPGGSRTSFTPLSSHDFRRSLQPPPPPLSHGPGGTRTHDHSVKSRVLYQLSYQPQARNINRSAPHLNRRRGLPAGALVRLLPVRGVEPGTRERRCRRSASRAGAS